MPQTTGQFLDLPPELSGPASRYAVLPVPYEGTVSYKPGTAAGPAAILDASAQVELFDEELLGDFTAPGIATYPAVESAPTSATQMDRVREAAGPIMRDGKFLLTLGGEHSITAPLVELAAQVHGPISVLQIDAHADLRDQYEGDPHSHAAVMRRVVDHAQGICQVGIRNFSQEEYENCQPLIERCITPAKIAADPDWIESALAQLGDRVYITVDIDGLDPAIAPGTGTPEPGGLDWRQVTSLLRRVCAQRQVVGADIVEVMPIPPNHVTEFLAARLAYKIIAYTQRA